MAFGRNLEDRSRNLVVAFDRLVRVGIDADHECVALVSGRANSSRNFSAAFTFALKRVSKSRPVKSEIRV
jgi:hypothetical protein